MAFPSDLEIARGAALKPLEDIADAMGITSHLLEPHGEEVMKIKLEAIAELASQPAASQRIPSHGVVLEELRMREGAGDKTDRHSKRKRRQKEQQPVTPNMRNAGSGRPGGDGTQPRPPNRKRSRWGHQIPAVTPSIPGSRETCRCSAATSPTAA